MSAIVNKVTGLFIAVGVMSYDFGLFVLNTVTPNLKKGHVIEKGKPGHNLTWPEYVPPGPGDSRSACPMLNAMANHGILPHDGKNITFKELTAKIHETFNFATTFCFFSSKYASDFLKRSYWKDTFDLEEISKHNAIEHDASLTRQDVAMQPDQGKPDLGLVNELLKGATGKMPNGSPQLTKADLIRALAQRRADAKRTNDQFTESGIHRWFGSSNSSTMLTIFDGAVDDLTPMLTEERFSEHWEPRVYSRFGLPMAKFNALTMTVERGVKKMKVE